MTKHRLLGVAAALLVLALVPTRVRLAAAETTVEQAWQALPHFQDGQDMAPLLAVQREVIRAMTSAKTRTRCARHLANILESSDTTPAARKFVCLQLRQVGTAEQVPLLRKLLLDEPSTQMARFALQSIRGPEAGAALREGLTRLDGAALVGVIHSVAARHDAAAVNQLKRLAENDATSVTDAALWALGTIGGQHATDYLLKRAQQTQGPIPLRLAVPLQRCADAADLGGQSDTAHAINTLLTNDGQLTSVRRAALTSLLNMAGEHSMSLVLQWLSSSDSQRRRIATGKLAQLPSSQLDTLINQLAELPNDVQLAVIEIAAAQRGSGLLPMAQRLITSTDPALRRAGIRCLGRAQDAAAIPLLVAMLGDDDDVGNAAESALTRLPSKLVTPTLIKTMQNQPARRTAAIRVLIAMRSYDAIDPLVELAASADPADYRPAMEGLRGICDPDKTDIPRLVRLLLRAKKGSHRDEAERTIVIVCAKLPQNADRSTLVRQSLAKLNAAPQQYLPLLGRLGGAASLQEIRSRLDSPDAAVRDAAVRALCNWPTAEVVDNLMSLARSTTSAAHRQWALRAYVRVVTLKSERSDEQTLGMLKQAMQMAHRVEDQRLIIERAASVRIMATVTWLATYLDQAELAQSACKSIVELAHHRFLRQPNITQFRPLLDRIIATSDDPETVEQAKRYRLGL